MREWMVLRHFIRTTALLLGLSPTLVMSEPIPGADDPELVAAAQAWLNKENPDEALWAIGELAADCNVAARRIANHIVRSVIPYEHPGLTRDERNAFVPEDRCSERGSFSPYFVDLKEVPAFSWGPGGDGYARPEEWIADAQTLLDAGKRETFLQLMLPVVSTYPTIDIEATLFAQTVLAQDEEDWGYVWLEVGFDQSLMGFWERYEPEKATARRERWGDEGWIEAQHLAFQHALNDQRWEALRAYGALRIFEGGFTEKFDLDESHKRLADLLFGVFVQNEEKIAPPNDEELKAIGELYLRQAKRTPRSLPVINLCERQCPDQFLECVAVGNMSRIRKAPESSAMALEPVISASDYYASERALDDVIRYLPLIQSWQQDWLPLPQCLVEAADGQMK